MKKIFFLISLLAFPSIVSALTVSDIKTQIRRNIRDTDTSNPRYDDTVLLDLINEGQNEINNQTMLSNSVTIYTLTNGTSYYSLPTDYFTPNEIYFKKNTGETIKLSEVKQDKLYQSKPDWERTRGEPNIYWISDSTLTVSGGTVTKRISYIPVPNNLSTGTITMWYFTQISNVVNDSDIPFNGAYELLPFHYAIVYYVTMRLKVIDGIIDEANAYQSLYSNSVSRLNNMLYGTKPVQTQATPQQ